jgi:hypothetical protein
MIEAEVTRKFMTAGLVKTKYGKKILDYQVVLGGNLEDKSNMTDESKAYK